MDFKHDCRPSPRWCPCRSAGCFGADSDGGVLLLLCVGGRPSAFSAVALSGGRVVFARPSACIRCRLPTLPIIHLNRAIIFLAGLPSLSAVSENLSANKNERL